MIISTGNLDHIGMLQFKTQIPSYPLVKMKQLEALHMTIGNLIKLFPGHRNYTVTECPSTCPLFEFFSTSLR